MTHAARTRTPSVRREHCFLRASVPAACGPFRYYYEACMQDDGLGRFGWSTVNATLELGCDKFGFG